MAEAKTIVVVLGMHRSGTSAVTRGLKVLGVELGQRLMPPVPGNNQRGFWEDKDLSAVNDEVLAALGSSWHSVGIVRLEKLAGDRLSALRQRATSLLSERLSNVPRFGFKDPRTCRLLSFWQPIFADLSLQERYVIADRNPLSVAQSLAARDGFGARKSYLLWLGHVIASMVHTDGKRRVVLEYDALLDDPRPQLERVARVLDLPFGPEAAQELSAFEEFLAKDLRHTTFAPSAVALEPDLPALAKDVYTAHRRLATDEAAVNDPANAREWRRFEQALESLAPALDLIDDEGRALIEAVDKVAPLAEREREARALKELVARQEAELAALRQDIARTEEELSRLSLEMASRDKHLAQAAIQLAEREHQVRSLHAVVGELRAAAAIVESRSAAREAQQEEASARTPSSRITTTLERARRLFARPPRT